MALASAEGDVSLVVEKLVDTVANATHFLTFTGEATVGDAKDHIYRSALPIPTGSYTASGVAGYRPFCMVYPGPVNAIRYSKDASGNYYVLSGTATLWFEQDADTTVTYEESTRLWHNMIGKLIRQTSESDPFSGILDFADTADRITIYDLSVEFERAAKEELSSLGDYQRAFMELEWGLQS